MLDGQWQPHSASNPRDHQRAQVSRVLPSPLCFIHRHRRLSLTFSFFHRTAANSARFATVMFMFRHRGRMRVALSNQDVAGGGVDRLFDEAIAAGAEDFDQASGTGQGVEVEVTFCFSSVSGLAVPSTHLIDMVGRRQIMCAANALGKMTDALARSGLSQGLLSSELIYAPAEDIVGDPELGSGVKELVADLEENEATLRVWTTLDS